MSGSWGSARRAVIGLVSALIVGVLAALPAAACSCAQVTVAEQIKKADLLVRGEVTGIENPAVGAESMALYTVTVTTVWKGPVGPDSRVVTVMSAASGASCGLEGIEEGEDIVLFAQATDASNAKAIAAWESSLCGGTAAAADVAPKVEAELGAGRTLAPTAGTVTATSKPTLPPLDETPNSESTAGSATTTSSTGGPAGGVTPAALFALVVVVAGGVVLAWGSRPRRR